MTRLRKLLKQYCTCERLWHFAKFGSVGAFGVVLNILLFITLSMFIEPNIASALTFICCGQYAFFAHAFLTWRDARERKLRAAWLLFIFGNVGAASINFAAFFILDLIGLWQTLVYFGALTVSMPFSYTWNAVVVFPTKTMPEQFIKDAWQQLVDRNKYD